MSPTGADGPGFKSFRIADHCNIRGDFPSQWKLGFPWSWGVGSQSKSGAALNLSQLAHLLLGSGIPTDLCHGKKDAYSPKASIDIRFSF
jgi:hypothetical protein